MEAFSLDLTQLPELNKVIIECSKNYFLVKNRYYEQIQEIQDSFITKIDLCRLLDTQHNLVKDLDNVVKYLLQELSFRRLIIERKDHILKDLNKVMMNKFIDQIYKQGLEIDNLKKERNILQKYKDNTICTYLNEITDCKRKSKPNQRPLTINNCTHTTKIPINIIVPRNNYEYNGTISFFNKNIDRFINIKNGNGNDSHKERSNLHKISSTKNIPYHNNYKLTYNSDQSMNKFKQGKTRSASLECLFNKTTQSNISNLSISNTNNSMNSTVNKTPNYSINPTRHTAKLLNKSYDMVQKYHHHPR